MTQLINHGGDCRTAPATPGLLKRKKEGYRDIAKGPNQLKRKIEGQKIKNKNEKNTVNR